MSLIRCPYCDQANSEGAKFCNACGGALHLAPCPHCGAVLDVTNTVVCYQCHRPVPGRGSYDLAPPPTIVEQPEGTSTTSAIERAAPFAAPAEQKPAPAAPAAEQPTEPATPAANNVHAFTPAARKAPAPVAPASEQAPAAPPPAPDQARAVSALRAYWTPEAPSPAGEKTPEPAAPAAERMPASDMPAAQPALSPAAKEAPAISPPRVKADYGDLWVVDEPASAAAEHAPAGGSPPAEPAAEASSSPPRRRAPMIVAAAGVVVAIGMLAYHYRSDSPADGPRPAAKGEASERGATPNTGVIGRTPPAEAPKAPLAPPTVAVEPPKAPVASPGQAPLQPPKPQVESAKAPAPPAPLRSEKSAVITRLPEAAPGTPLRAPERPSRTQPCTEATAALGLCVLKPAPKGKPPASVQSAATREQAIDAGRTVGQQPAPSQTCTEAVAALGLCTPKPTPRKE